MLLTRRLSVLVVLSGFTLFISGFLLYPRVETTSHATGPVAAPPANDVNSTPYRPVEDQGAKLNGNDEYTAPAASFLHGSLKGTATAILYSANSADAIPKTISKLASAAPTSAELDTESLRIAITETGGSHEEVVAALAHAFGSQKNTELSLYLLLKRYGVEDVIQSFDLDSIQSPIRSSSKFPKQFNETQLPHVVVSATCELDLFRSPVKQSLQNLLEKGQTYLFCVVHHADRWAEPEKEEALKPWVEKQRVMFLALSPHTAEYLRKTAMSRWDMKNKPTVRYFVPVFPAPVLARNSTGEEDGLSFAMQGNFDPHRRDYGTILKEFEQFLQPQEGKEIETDMPPQYRVTNATNVTLHILGHGKKPGVPETVAEHVRFDTRLNYTQYYSLLSRTFALVPAFANSEYLDRKTSSSVPAALIGGSPLVASQEILQAYRYLPRDAVWFREEGETDMDVVAKALMIPAEERQRKREMVRKCCAGIVQGNTRIIERWIGEAVQKT